MRHFSFSNYLFSFVALLVTFSASLAHADSLIFGDIVKESITVVSGATLVPIPGAAVQVSTLKGQTFPGSAGFADATGVFTSLFNNTNDTSGTRTEQVYVPPGYDYHYGYNSLDGQYEYFYGYDPESGGYQNELVPFTNYTQSYNVAAAAAGYDLSIQKFDANLGVSPTQLKVTIRIPLTNPPDYAIPFLLRLYKLTIGRDLDGYGASYWSDQLRFHTRAEVAMLVLRSPERNENLINYYFDRFLGRLPDLGKPAELAGVQKDLAELTTTGTQEDVLKGILGGSEYYKRKGGTKASFITGLFADVLGRAPTAQERSQVGSSQSAILNNFFASVFYQKALIQTLYQTYLRRSAGPGEINAWLPAFKTLNTFQIQANILSAPEFLTIAYPIQ